jgi:DNA-directed RNA polymerase specialized sigma24 family protein
MAAHDPLAKRGTHLLLAVAAGDTDAAREYDTLLFDFLRATARTRGRFMAADALSRAGAATVSSVSVPPGTDLDEVAVVAAEIALARAKASALRFDPERSDGASWALGNLGHAYRDALRDLSRTRRLLVEVPVDDTVLYAHAGAASDDPSMAAVEQDLLNRALALLNEDEQYVVVAQIHFGLTYREIALYRFGDEAATKKVDRVLQSAKRKLRDAQLEWTENG